LKKGLREWGGERRARKNQWGEETFERIQVGVENTEEYSVRFGTNLANGTTSFAFFRGNLVGGRRPCA